MVHLTVLTVTWTPETPWRLPDQPAVMIRGMLGAALRHMACTEPKAACPSCPHRRSCRYGSWWHPTDHQAPSYRLLSVSGGGRTCSARMPLRATLVLWGRQPATGWVLAALERMGQFGLGPDRIAHRVSVAHARGHDGLPGGRGEAGSGVLSLADLVPGLPAQPTGCVVRWLTPFQGPKRDGGTDAPSAEALVRAAIGRVRSVLRQQQRSVDAWWPDPAGMTYVAADWRHVSASRASRGQGAHDLSGWSGTVQWGPEVLPYVDVMAAMPWLGWGRGGTSGLGSVQVRWLE